ncbi:MAG: XdhC family protein [Trueperaceae bacterium]|nr:XdhC family protein [Trueperaceae bacterium]
MDTLERIFQLKQSGERFAIATVVARRPPVSSQLGDKAIIFEDGRLEGFIGGACSREIVRKQALEVLDLERSRLVRISPDPIAETSNANHDEICVPMTCASEGAVDIYLEPYTEKKRMLIVGASPIAIALARQADLQGYELTLVFEKQEIDTINFALEDLKLELVDIDALKDWLNALPGKQKGNLEAVVASMGHYDEEALAPLARANPRYLGLVSSQKRGAKIIDLLLDIGIPKADVDRIKNPAGLDLAAKTPNEVAVSIVAEMIQLRRQAARAARQILEQEEAICPTCSMKVSTATARHKADYKGQSYYFCCPNCKHHFLKDPEKYLAGAKP